MKSVSIRLLIPVAVFVGALLSAASFFWLFGGPVGFAWVVKHGGTGPLVIMAVHHGSVQPSSVLLAVVLLGGLAWRAISSSRWALVVSIISVLAWIIVGLGAGV